MHKIQITGWEKVKQPREQQMVGRRGGDNIGYFSECFWCAQHWQKTITGQINEAGLAQPCFMDREACGTKWLGYQGHTAHQQWRLQSPLKGRPAEGRQESPHVSLYYILNHFSFFPTGLILFFYNKVLFFGGKKALDRKLRIYHRAENIGKQANKAQNSVQ